MTHVRYLLTQNRPADYQLELLRRGCCPYLAEVSLSLRRESVEVAVDTAGLFHLKTCLETGKPPETDFRLDRGRIREVLFWLRRLTEAVDALEEYLIFEEDVSLDLPDLYFDGREGRPRLLLKPSGRPLLESLCRLCLDIHCLCPESNADLVERRLVQRNAEQLLDRRALLAFLSSWSLEVSP